MFIHKNNFRIDVKLSWHEMCACKFCIDTVTVCLRVCVCPGVGVIKKFVFIIC